MTIQPSNGRPPTMNLNRTTSRKARLLPSLLVACALFASCSSDSGAIDLDTLQPRASVDSISPGGTYDITFEPKIDDLQLSVGDTPDGITATIEDGPTSGTRTLKVIVNQDADVSGKIDIPINVINGSEESVVLWPFNVEP